MPRFAERIAFAARLAFGRWQPPALTPAQAWEGLPDWWTGPDDPARDAIGAGLAYVFTQVAGDAARMSRMHLRKHARLWCLDLVAAAAGLTREGDEVDGELRARVAVVEDAVSPVAIAAAVRAIRPDAIVLCPARHAFFVGRTAVGRPPIDFAATRLAADGRYRFYPVGAARVWSQHRARIHVVVPGGLDAAAAAPVGRFYVGRAGARPAPSLAWPARLAATLHRLTAAGVRWSATIEPLP